MVSTFSACDEDPVIWTNNQRAIIFPEASMKEALRDAFYSYTDPNAVEFSNWIPGLQCLNIFKKAVAAQAGRGIGELRSVLYTVGVTTTVLSYRCP